MQKNHVAQALNHLSVFPSDPLMIKHKASYPRGDGVTLHSLLSSSSCGLFGESLGTESSVEVLNDDEYRNYSNERKSQVGLSKKSKRDQKLLAERQEFPPPIPSLVQTGNLQPLMPWILRRHYTSDGRLVITEERNPCHEYFRVNRCDGRLTLDLVSLEVSEDVGGESEDDGERESDHGTEGSRDDEEEKDCDRSIYFWGGDVSIRNGARCVVKGVTVPAAIRVVPS